MDTTIPDSVPQFKQCYDCKQHKPATPEFFVRNKRYADGLNYRCKECYKAYVKVDHTREVLQEGQKRCTKCTNLFPATSDFFYRDKTKPDGLRPACRKCERAQGKIYDDTHAEDKSQYYQDHKEEINARQQQFRKDHQEELSQKQHDYRVMHKEHMRKRDRGKYERHKGVIRERGRRYRAEHQEQILNQRRAYYKTPRGRAVARGAFHRRKALKKATPGTLTAEQIQVKFNAQRGKCYYSACGHAKFKKVDGKYIYHVEHTVPLSRPEFGPRNDVNYVVLACPACNMSKHNKLPHEWPEGGRLF